VWLVGGWVGCLPVKVKSPAGGGWAFWLALLVRLQHSNPRQKRFQIKQLICSYRKSTNKNTNKILGFPYPAMESVIHWKIVMDTRR
jgi:hypothetical protein